MDLTVTPWYSKKIVLQLEAAQTMPIGFAANSGHVECGVSREMADFSMAAKLARATNVLC